MTDRGLDSLRQDVLGLHQFGGATSEQIAERLQLPEEMVKDWIIMDQVLLHEIGWDEP